MWVYLNQRCCVFSIQSSHASDDFSKSRGGQIHLRIKLFLYSKVFILFIVEVLFCSAAFRHSVDYKHPCLTIVEKLRGTIAHSSESKL